MSDNTKIEWTDRTWNPVRGCSRVSEGCRNCYAERFAARFAKPGEPFHGFVDDGKWTGRVELVPEKLAEPLSWRKPARVFVNSMSDLFHESLTDHEILKIFDVMHHASRHTFQILTKRPERMRRWFEKKHERMNRPIAWRNEWPLPNVWLGVSVENQEAMHRVRDLQMTPAAVRFVSAEPLIGPLDFYPHLGLSMIGGVDVDPINWVIVGGESGPGARPCRLDWIASIVRQCKDAGVAAFVKQLGANIIDRRGSQGRDEYGMWPYAVPSEFIDEEFTKVKLWHRKGGDPSEWPEALRVREFPNRTPEDSSAVAGGSKP